MLTRRQFALLLTAVAAGCKRQKSTPATLASHDAPATGEKPKEPDSTDAGPLTDFTNNEVYSHLRNQGILIIHRNDQLFALSAVCPHRGCKVRVAADQSFYCKCHGSTFNRDGQVTKGPATRDLPRLSIAVDEARHVLVKT